MSNNTYTPREGSVASRVIELLQQDPTLELSSVDIAQRLGVNSASVHTHLASALQAELLRRRTDALGTVVYFAGPKTRSAPAQQPAAVAAAAPAAPKRRGLLPPLDPAALVVRRNVQDPGRVDQRRAAYFAALDKLDAPKTGFDLDRRYRGALAKAAQEYAKLPGNTGKRFAFRTHPEQPQALCLVLREA